MAEFTQLIHTHVTKLRNRLFIWSIYTLYLSHSDPGRHKFVFIHVEYACQFAINVIKPHRLGK
jgi:hypothetical protein